MMQGGDTYSDFYFLFFLNTYLHLPQVFISQFDMRKLDPVPQNLNK